MRIFAKCLIRETLEWLGVCTVTSMQDWERGLTQGANGRQPIETLLAQIVSVVRPSLWSEF